MALENKLTSLDIELVKHNIWEDDSAAAVVRLAANGNETVPTVDVGGQFLVNPTAKQVLNRFSPEDNSNKSRSSFFSKRKKV